MSITIRDKHTFEEKEFDELFELYTDSMFINLTVLTKSGKKRHYLFSKTDFEIAYIG